VERIYGMQMTLTEASRYAIREGEEIRGLCKCFLEEFNADSQVVQQQELQSFLSQRRTLSLRQLSSILHLLKVDLAYAFPTRHPLSSTDIEVIKRHFAARFQIQNFIDDSFEATLNDLLRPLKTEVLRVWSLRQLIEGGNLRKTSGEQEAFLAEISGYFDLLSPEALQIALKQELGEKLMSKWELRAAVSQVLGTALPLLQPSFVDKVMEYPFDLSEPVAVEGVLEALDRAVDGSLREVFQQLCEATQPASPASDLSQLSFPALPSKATPRSFTSNLIQERHWKKAICSIARCYMFKRGDVVKTVNRKPEEVEVYDYDKLEIEALRITAHATIAENLYEKHKPKDDKTHRINQEGLLNLLNSGLVQDEKVKKVRTQLNKIKHLDDDKILSAITGKDQQKTEKKRPQENAVEPVFTPGLALRGQRLAHPKPLDKHCCSCDCTLC